MTEAVGVDGIIDWIRIGLQTFPDLSLEVTRWATDGDAVLIEFAASATVAGRPISGQGTDRLRLRMIVASRTLLLRYSVAATGTIEPVGGPGGNPLSIPSLVSTCRFAR